VRLTGQLYWNDEPITEQALQAQLRVTAQKNPQPELQIQADKSAKYQQVATVMADAKNAGMTKIGFLPARGLQ
jgi:biopolymer transport protein ExbD